MALCAERGWRVSDAMLTQEVERGRETEAEVWARLRQTLDIMRLSCREPLESPVRCIGGMIGGEGRRLMARQTRGEALCGGLVTKAVAYAMGVMEQNSAMGRVVAAPTAGSSGVLPGVLFALGEERGLPDEALLRGLLCAGAVGYLYMRNATVAGAEAGCQAEVGAASAMTAAAVTELCGGTPQQSLDASAIAIGNLLGLVCDPVAGLVQAPCQARNAIGATNALTCAEIVLSGTPALVPFDEMLAAMYKIGRDMPAALRETSLGGCAATPTGCRWRDRVLQGEETLA